MTVRSIGARMIASLRRSSGSDRQRNASAPSRPAWFNDDLSSEELAELGRLSIRQEGAISSAEMRAWIDALPGYVPRRARQKRYSIWIRSIAAWVMRSLRRS